MRTRRRIAVSHHEQAAPARVSTAVTSLDRTDEGQDRWTVR
ncbi:hypothetical protein [Streptomyces antibioticus]